MPKPSHPKAIPAEPAQPAFCNAKGAVAFITAHQAEAAQVAGNLGLPVENLLGLSGIESAWGTSAFATNGNNFFSLHGGKDAPFANGSMQALQGAWMSKFPSYLACAQSFASQYGESVRGKKGAEEFARALMPRYNSGVAPLGNPRFVEDTVSTIQMTKKRMGC